MFLDNIFKLLFWHCKEFPDGFHYQSRYWNGYIWIKRLFTPLTMFWKIFHKLQCFFKLMHYGIWLVISEQESNQISEYDNYKAMINLPSLCFNQVHKTDNSKNY